MRPVDRVNRVHLSLLSFLSYHIHRERQQHRADPWLPVHQSFQRVQVDQGHRKVLLDHPRRPILVRPVFHSDLLVLVFRQIHKSRVDQGDPVVLVVHQVQANHCNLTMVNYLQYLFEYIHLARQAVRDYHLNRVRQPVHNILAGRLEEQEIQRKFRAGLDEHKLTSMNRDIGRTTEQT